MNNLNDCYSGSDNPVRLADAVTVFSSKLKCHQKIEKVYIKDATNRILAEDLSAQHNIPPQDNSAVDGYAVYFDDLNTNCETSLPLVDRVSAGHPIKQQIGRGAAVQIFTGAPLPKNRNLKGPDTIFMKEDVRIESNNVILPVGAKRYANRRKLGEDVKLGDLVLRKGHQLKPQDISMVASLGYDQVPVYQRLKVAVFSTGDEIQDVGEKLRLGSIYDANRYFLISMLEKMNCEVNDFGIFPDIKEQIYKGILNASEDHDILLTSGGVSKGEEDHIKNIIENLGVLNFWNFAIKPGRPIALGCLKKGHFQVPFIGLPGNPVAVMITFLRIARPIILALSGCKDLDTQFFPVISGFNYDKKVGRREWLRASLTKDFEGNVIAKKFHSDGSGIISSMVESSGLIELSEECEGVKVGDLVNYLPFSEVI